VGLLELMCREVNADHHIGRNVGTTKLIGNKPTGAAFIRSGEASTSGDCLEDVDPTRIEAFKKLYSVLYGLRGILRPYKDIAWFNYGQAKMILPGGFHANYDNPINPADPSHVGFSIPGPDLVEADKLAAICELAEAKTGLPVI